MSVLPVAKIASAALAASAALSAGHAITTAGRRVELTFRVIDRAGHQVKPLDLDLLSMAPGANNNDNIDLGSGTHRQVRVGRYNVAVWIGTGSGPQSFTLEDRIVDVTRSRTITLDARLGRRVRVGLRAAGAVQEVLELAPIVRGFWAFNPSVIADSEAGGTATAPAYVVPMAARSVTLYVYSVWEKQGNSVANPSPFRYDIINVHRGGIPAHPIFPVRRSGLARVSVRVRATDQDQQATLLLSPMGNSPPLPLNAGTTLGATPVRLTSYRSPGYQWQPIVDLTSPSGEIRDDALNMNPYGRGHFTERYFSAVLAPQEFQLSADVMDRGMGVGINGSPFGDPLHPGDTDESSGGTALMRLFSGSKLLAKSHLDSFGGNLNARVPLARHMYSLRLDAARGSSATVSTQLHADWHFLAHGTTGGFGFTGQIYTAQLLPAGLDARNRAAADALTPVALHVSGTASISDSVLLNVVRVQASADDGKTWHLVRVRRSGDHYVFSVRDPRHAGFVSLRAYVRDRAGNSELLTVIHAYGVR